MSKTDNDYEEIRIRYDYNYNSDDNDGPVVSSISDGLTNKKGSAKSRQVQTIKTYEKLRKIKDKNRHKLEQEKEKKAHEERMKNIRKNKASIYKG